MACGVRPAAPRPAGLGGPGGVLGALPPPARVRTDPGSPRGCSVDGDLRGLVALDRQRLAQ
eukprot:11098856-Alexandrium_andersonii.AAC.1